MEGQGLERADPRGDSPPVVSDGPQGNGGQWTVDSAYWACNAQRITNDEWRCPRIPAEDGESHLPSLEDSHANSLFTVPTIAAQGDASPGEESNKALYRQSSCSREHCLMAYTYGRIHGADSGPQTFRTRHEALDLRIKVQSSHGKVKNCMRLFNESRAQFMTAALGSTPVQGLQEIDEELRADSENLEAAIEELRQLHVALSSKDMALFRDESQRHGNRGGYLDSIIDPSTIESLTIGPNREPEGPGGPEEPEPEPELPAPLAEYFDLLGDIKLAEERMEYELPTDQAERAQERERRRDQDEPLSTTDDVFEQSLQDERSMMQADLESKRSRANELHRICLENGLDPDPSNYARQSESGSSVDTTDRVNSNVERWLDDPERPEGIDLTSEAAAAFHDEELSGYRHSESYTADSAVDLSRTTPCSSALMSTTAIENVTDMNS